MSGPTRPIPISHGHRSQRSSPVGAHETAANDAHDALSPNGMISHSCPVVNGNAAYFGPRHIPPRAPVIGSLPEPSFMLGGADDGMPELVLPPPAHFESGSASARREASVVQVASSCPVDIGFFRQGSPAQHRMWTPSPRASDEFDLSKSPALAMMSAMRQARRPSTDSRRSDEDRFAYGIAGARRISDPPFRPQPSNSFVSTSHFQYMESFPPEDDETEFGMQNLSLDGSSAMQPISRTNPDELTGLPPRRPERRGSYDGGIFHFEDQ